MWRHTDDIGARAVPVTVRAAEPLADPADLLGPGPVEDRTDEIPRPATDRLVPVPGAGPRGWLRVVRAVALACWGPLLAVTTFGTGMSLLLSGSVSNAVVIAPVLTDLAGGAGLLLLPMLWMTVVAVNALLLALSVAGVVGVVTGWAADGRRPGAGALARLVGHRVGRLWAWLLLVYVVEQGVAAVLPSSVASGIGHWPSTGALKLTGTLDWVLILISWALAAAVGLLAPVVLFERARGPRRALRLFTRGPRPAVFGMVLAAGAPVLLPALTREVADGAGGTVAAILPASVGTLLWLVAATVTYAAAAAVTSGPTVLTAPFLKAALSAEEA